MVTEVRIHDDSAAATIVEISTRDRIGVLYEISTRDRIGVLYAITQVLADLGLDISLPKVATEGERVDDVFYVTRAGRRITGALDRCDLLARLSAAAGEPGPTG